MAMGTFGLTFFLIIRSLFKASYFAPELLRAKTEPEQEIAFAQKLGLYLFFTTWVPALMLGYAVEKMQ